MAGAVKAEYALNPLGSDLDLAITPSTAILYGFVRNTEGFGLENVTVTVNAMTATTDDLGRYIVSGIPNNMEDDQLFVNTARAGYPATRADSTNNPAYHNASNPHPNPVPGFAANTVTQYNIELYGSNNTVSISGLVTESGTNAPIKGVEILVDGADPLNATGSGSRRALVTDDNGAYTAVVQAQPFADPLVEVSAKKSGWHFLPEAFPVPAIAGSSGTANFEGRRAAEITGRVTAPGGGPMSDVTVTAYADAGMTDSVSAVTTTATGTFSVFVPTLSGTVWLGAKPRSNYTPSSSKFVSLEAAARYVWFDAPTTRPDGSIAVIPGQPLQFGTFKGNSVQPRITRVQRVAIGEDFEGQVNTSDIVPAASDRTTGDGFLLVKGEPTDTVRVTWQYETRNATGAYSAAVGAGVALTTGTGTSLAAPTSTPTTPDADARTAADGTSETHTRVTTYILSNAGDAPDYGDINVRIGHAVTDGSGTERANTDDVSAVSAPRALAGVDVDVRSLSVTRSGSSITATWFGPGSPRLDHRIALHVKVDATNNLWEWVVFDADPAEPAETRATTIPGDTGSNWGRWSWTFDLGADANGTTGNPNSWPGDGPGNATYSLTGLEANMLRVDTRTSPTGSWKIDHGTAAIPGS